MADYEAIKEENFSKLPGPLYSIWELYLKETQPLRKVFRLRDALEWAVKWHVVLTLADLLKQGNIPSETRMFLAGGLYTPALGKWQEIFRESLRALKNPSFQWKSSERLSTVSRNEKDIVAFRNKYHVTHSDETCKQDIQIMEPVFRQLVNSPIFLDIDLIAADDRGTWILKGGRKEKTGRPLETGKMSVVLPTNEVLCLWPMAFYDGDDFQKTERYFFYFNAIRHNSIEILNYERSITVRRPDLFDSFFNFFPLAEWSKIEIAPIDHFQEKLRLQAGNFVGRINEKNKILNFCRNENGVFLIVGSPGAGKTSLMIQAILEMQDLKDPILTAGYFPRLANNENQEEMCAKDISVHLKDHYGIDSRHAASLRELLDKIAVAAANRKIVFFVDDVQNVPGIMSEFFKVDKRFSLVAASRPSENVESLFEKIAPGKNIKMILPPIIDVEIRKIVNEMASKRKTRLEEVEIFKIIGRANGFPMAAKALVESHFHSKHAAIRNESLPLALSSVFLEIVKRLTAEGEDRIAYDFLHLLAESERDVSETVAAGIIGTGEEEIRRAAVVCREAVDIVKRNESGYLPRMFHPLMKEWMKKIHPRECAKIGRTLLKMNS